MDGDEVDQSWRGGLEIDYKYGPGFAGENATEYVKPYATYKGRVRGRFIHKVY